MKALRKSSLLIALSVLAACSTNPATGEQQFTALMPASQEASVGAQEHAKVEQTFGKFIQGPLNTYVNEVGQKVARNTERTDVTYKFYVIDSPIINAFALPGGYVYVSRGLLALADSEAELAAVLGHEIGHVTARHSAERVSQGFLAQLGAVVLSAATGSEGVAQAANLGSELYIKSYSRGQEHQADELGVRYLNRAGYDTFAMAGFLQSMAEQTKLDAAMKGQDAPQFNYFSTHPQTENRVAEASAEAARYSPSGTKDDGRARHLAAINNMVYGDSESQGFVKGQTFYHPEIGFTFGFPDGFIIQNEPSQVAAVHKGTGAIIVFDAVNDKTSPDPYTFLTQKWMKSEAVNGARAVMINGLRAAQGVFPATVNGKAMNVHVTAIEWKPGQFFRFQVAVPTTLDSGSVAAVNKSPQSFRTMTASEKAAIKPQRIQIVSAKAGDSVASLSAAMPFDTYNQDVFRVLNSLKSGEALVAGRQYKRVIQ
jgi:predicted Zn-dependent protease